MYRYREDKTIITEQSLDISEKTSRATNVSAMSFPIMISWQSCGNVLAGGLQRLMIYVWVYRVINCVFFRLFLYLSISFTQTTCFFSVVVENFLSLLKNMIKLISFEFDIFPQILISILNYICDEIFANFAYDYSIPFMLNDVFSWIQNVF